jgi:hypothetical protein
MSIPIFSGKDHALASKHFRPDEHYWYFTKVGLMGFMLGLGFTCRSESSFEIALGREDIQTFAFRRE